MRDSKAEFRFPDFTRHSVTSDAPKTPFETPKSKPRASELPLDPTLFVNFGRCEADDPYWYL